MRRGRLEILFDILEAIETEGNPTNIMFKTRISWNILKKKLDFLVERGLAEFKNCTARSEGAKTLSSNPEGKKNAAPWKGDTEALKGGRKRYYLTEKGRRLLQLGREIRKILGG